MTSGSGSSSGSVTTGTATADTGLAGRAAAIEFSNNQPKEGSPETPFRLRPEVSYQRKFFGSGEIVMPDGKRVRTWGFEDETSGRKVPAPLIRAREGQVVHVTVHASKGPHTIHLHGIEPEPWNDGVGHTSFEVSGSYTYQFRPASAGTYFYHCHVNTVLHVQMGMFGPLVVDPDPERDAGGRRLAFTGGPAYDVERIWAAFSIDPRWRGLEHAAGLDGEDVGLNDFRPRYFLINGVPQPKGAGATISHRDVAVRAKVGQTVLLRLISADYFPLDWTFGRGVRFGDALDVQAVAADGRPFVARRPDGTTFHPRFARQTIRTGPAERVDLIAQAARPDVYPVTVRTLNWVSLEDAGQRRADRVVGTTATTITFE